MRNGSLTDRRVSSKLDCARKRKKIEGKNNFILGEKQLDS